MPIISLLNFLSFESQCTHTQAIEDLTTGTVVGATGAMDGSTIDVTIPPATTMAGTTTEATITTTTTTRDHHQRTTIEIITTKPIAVPPPPVVTSIEGTMAAIAICAMSRLSLTAEGG